MLQRVIHDLEDATGISLYLEDKTTTVVETEQARQHIHSVPAAYHVGLPRHRHCSQFLPGEHERGGRKYFSWCRRGVGDGRFGEKKSDDDSDRPPARHAVPLPPTEGNLWVHKGHVPCSYQGSARKTQHNRA